jgi:pyridoxal phosphate enzyme (YggS family)
VENNCILDRIESLQEKIYLGMVKAGRDISDIRVMAVTKNASMSHIIQSREAGIDLFGENYLKDATDKIASLIQTENFRSEQFHLIGHLQTNKVKKAVSLFYSIDSIDSIKIAKEVAAQVINTSKPYPIMIEVKTSVDENKFGFLPDRIIDDFGEILSFPELEIQGLMTIGSLSGSYDEAKRCFASLYQTKVKIEQCYHYKIPCLSMGMSDDFAIAIEEGSNMLRIGRAIFGGL